MSILPLGDFDTTEIISIPFNTFDSNDPTASVTITDLVAADVKIHKDGGLTQRSSANGVTVSIDFDGITGNHVVFIDLSDNTDVGYYSAGSTYQVRIEGTTVDGGTINAWIGVYTIGRTLRATTNGRKLNVAVTGVADADMIAISKDSGAADNLELMYDGTGYTDDTAPSSRSQVNNISVGSAAISTVADSFVKVGAEPETNDYTDTFALDSVYHIVEDDATSTDVYYEFDVTGVGVPTQFDWWGYAQSQGDSYAVYAYNWDGTSWDQIGSISGSNGTTQIQDTWITTIAHVGTGANLGKVRLRFLSSDGTAIATDRVLCSYAVVSQSVGYANGAIWVDTNGSNVNTEVYVDGVADNPVSTWAAALTLSTALGIKKFQIINGSSITLSGNSDNYTLLGANWTLVLNNQSIANAVFEGAEVTDVSTGSGFEFVKCKLGDGGGVTFEAGFILGCAISGDITFSGAGIYYFDQCFSGVAGPGTPSLDFGVAVGTTNVNFRHYSGGLGIENMGQAGTDTMSLEGHGQYVLGASCAGGSLSIRGHFKKTDNSGNVTISDDANFKSSVIHYGVAQGSGTGNNQIQLASNASVIDGAYDPAAVFIVEGTGAGQTRLILQYVGSTKTATVDRNWKVNPDATSLYRVLADAGREHVNEGLAQAGASTTITLNVLASSDDDAYNNQIIFIRSGTGEDQVRLVTDYDGTTKIAIIQGVWDTNPDSTSGYVMLPNHIMTTAETISAVDTAITANTEIDAILGDTVDMQPRVVAVETDTNEIQGKLPDNNIMGSGVTTDKDDEIDAILTGTANILADTADMQPRVVAVETDTNEIQGKLPDNNIMGSGVTTDKDDEIDAILTDTGTTLPATLATIDGHVDGLDGTDGKALISTDAQDLSSTLSINAGRINASSPAAIRLALAADQMIPLTVDDTAFAPTTTEFECDDITEATAEHYKGRIIIFTSGALVGQATSILEYVLTGGRGHFTVTALTETPANNITGLIV